MLGTDAQNGTVEQGGGVTPAGKNGTEQVAGQLGRWLFIAGVLVHGFPYKGPDGERGPFVIGRADDLDFIRVPLQPLCKHFKRIPQEEPHRDARRIGGESQNVKVLAGLQHFLVQPGAGAAIGQQLQRFAQVIFGDAGILGDTEHSHHAQRSIAGGGVLGPADHGGVAKDAAVIPVGQQFVQRGSISKFGIVAYGSVFSFFVFIGTR